MAVGRRAGRCFGGFAEAVARYAFKLRAIKDESGLPRVLLIGDEAWPVPIPIVRTGERWRFATEEGEHVGLSGAAELVFEGTLELESSDFVS